VALLGALMHELPSNFDEGLLSGCYLEMVSFGPSITKLDFARPQTTAGSTYKVAFSVEAGMSYSLKGTCGTRDFASPDSCAPLIGFLLKDVVGVSRVGVGSLRINFGEDGYISIEADDMAEFESYSIYLDNGGVIVV